MRNIVILISGTGSNMRALLRAAEQDQWASRHQARIAAVLSNRAQAPGLETARAHGIATESLDHRAFADRAAFDAALVQRIDQYQPALVLLAGFMRVLTAEFVAHYHGRLLNIHPSLLPAFAGLNTHQRALDAGCKFAGCTVHAVSAEVDAGPILEQAAVPILPGDSAQTLAARVLTQEHRIYPRAVEHWLRRNSREALK